MTEYRLQVAPGGADAEQMRAAVARHRISADELIARMRYAGMCAGREKAMVTELLNGGECTLAVALAVLSASCADRLTRFSRRDA